MVNMLAKAALLASVTAVAAKSIDSIAPKDLSVTDKTSILGVSKTLADGVMSYYPVDFNAYSWMAGAASAIAMLDYAHYTGNTRHDKAVAEMLAANVGPAHDFMVPAYASLEGNGDQALWVLAALTAAEHGLAVPSSKSLGVPSWLNASVNAWERMARRWDTATCGGGLPMDTDGKANADKTAAGNGGFLQISARLARLTGNQTYLDWANTVWDWAAGGGNLINDTTYAVRSSVDPSDNCSSSSSSSTTSSVRFTDEQGVFLLSAAILANMTGGDAVWTDRARGLLNATRPFFLQYSNASNVLTEIECEGVGTCDARIMAFKGYLAHALYQTSILVPSLAANIRTYMQATARAAAASCTGDNGNADGNGTTCGYWWFTGGFDGRVGLGPQVNALQAIQGLLLLDGAATEPIVSPATVEKESGAMGVAPAAVPWTVLEVVFTLFVWAM